MRSACQSGVRLVDQQHKYPQVFGYANGTVRYLVVKVGCLPAVGGASRIFVVQGLSSQQRPQGQGTLARDNLFEINSRDVELFSFALEAPSLTPPEGLPNAW